MSRAARVYDRNYDETGARRPGSPIERHAAEQAAAVRDRLTGGQLDLFEAPEGLEIASRSHRHDPDTSKRAARSSPMRRTSTRARLLEAYLEGAATDDEAGERAGVTAVYEARRRCSELRLAGYLVDTGARRSTSSGSAAMVCEITESGRSILASARAGR